MAQRRMFSKRIVGSGKFLKMPVSSQALYFHLSMNADDDGIVEAFQVIRQTGANEDDLKVLASKEYVKVLNEDLVTYVTDWKEHNLIRADRKVNSIYQKLLIQLLPEAQPVEPKPRSDTGKLTGRPMGVQRTAQDRLELGKVNRIHVSVRTEESFDQFWDAYPRKELKKRTQQIWRSKMFHKKLPEILAFIEKAKDTDRWQKGFIKQPPAFLNGECWNDDLASYMDSRGAGMAITKIN